MQQPRHRHEDGICPSAIGPISRRVLLAGGAGLVGAAALAARPAQAQGNPPPAVLPIQAPVRQDWLDKRHEEIIEPDLPIIDPHHHLWDRPGYRYLFPELLADVGSGHNIRATCYEQAREMYRADGPEELKSLGETAVRQRRLGDERLGQIRADAVHHRHHRLCRSAARRARQGYPRAAHRSLRRPPARHPQRLDLERRPDAEDLHRRRTSRAAAGQELSRRVCDPRPVGSHLRRLDVPDPARATSSIWRAPSRRRRSCSIIAARPLAIGPYAGKREEAFTEWRDRIREVASLPNTYVKLGGLGMKLIGFTFFDNDQPPSSQDLEKAWRPYIETCIAAFGPQRSMFESNFPVDKGTCSYQVLWNAFKRHRRRVFRRREDRPLQRRRREGLSPGDLRPMRPASFRGKEAVRERRALFPEEAGTQWAEGLGCVSDLSSAKSGRRPDFPWWTGRYCEKRGSRLSGDPNRTGKLLISRSI